MRTLLVTPRTLPDPCVFTSEWAVGKRWFFRDIFAFPPRCNRFWKCTIAQFVCWFRYIIFVMIYLHFFFFSLSFPPSQFDLPRLIASYFVTGTYVASVIVVIVMSVAPTPTNAKGQGQEQDQRQQHFQLQRPRWAVAHCSGARRLAVELR